MSKIPVFETERLILRAITEADAPAYAKNFIDYQIIGQLNPTTPWPFPESEMLNYLQTKILPKQGKNEWIWGIFLKNNPDELIGSIDLWREGHPENREFWLGRRFWGRGIMTEAVEPIITYAFEYLGFEKLIFDNAVCNKRSRRIKEKTGAHLLYVEPSKFVNPEYTEHEVWELTKNDWTWREMNSSNLQRKRA